MHAHIQEERSAHAHAPARLMEKAGVVVVVVVRASPLGSMGSARQVTPPV